MRPSITKKWPAKRLARLKTLAPTHRMDELIEIFNETGGHLRYVCQKYQIDYIRVLPKAVIQKMNQAKKEKPLDAKQSITLFLQHYKKQPLNQLLTSSWS